MYVRLCAKRAYPNGDLLNGRDGRGNITLLRLNDRCQAVIAGRFGRRRVAALLVTLAAAVVSSGLVPAVAQAQFHIAPVNCRFRHSCPSPIITGVSPRVALPGTKLIVKGNNLFYVSRVVIGGVAVDAVARESDLNYVGGFHARNNRTIVVIAPQEKLSGAPVTVTGVDANGRTVTTRTTFTYPLGDLRMTGPLPYDPQQIGDQQWANGRGRSLSLYPPKQLPFTTLNPVFYVATSFADDSNNYPENPPNSGHPAPYALGNTGQFSASLQMCDLSTKPGDPGSEGACRNWDNNVGQWITPFPASGSTLGLNGGTERGIIAINAGGLFDQQNLARTFRIVTSVQETDTNDNVIAGQRVDGRTSDPFTAVVSPTALIQLNVLPYTIIYHPPGDQSTVSFGTTTTYGTSLTLGNSNGNTETSTSSQSSSQKFSEAFAFGVGYTLGGTQSLDTTVTAGYGVTDDSTKTSSAATTIGTNTLLGQDPSLIPGSGNQCLSATNCPTNGPFTPATNAYLRQPFNDDTFELLVHPQFAIYALGGPGQDVLYGAVPVTAEITVRNLDACARGLAPLGQDPCQVPYSESSLIAPPTGVVYHGKASSVALTAKDAQHLLTLDPFYAGGQGADLPPTRALQVPGGGSYGSFVGNEVPNERDPTFINTQGEASVAGNKVTTTSSVNGVVGNIETAGFTMGGSVGGLNGSEGLTLTNGDTSSGNTTITTAYSDSTAVSKSVTTQAAARLNDVDNTTPGSNGPICKVCHDPLPAQPTVNVFLDRAFGSYMFQDPNAPAPRRRFGGAQVAQGFVAAEVLADQASEQFSDVPLTSRADGPIAFMTATHAMSGLGNGAFRPNAPLTQAQLATLMAGVVHVPFRETRRVFTRGGLGATVNAGELESAIAHAFHLSRRGAIKFERSGFGPLRFSMHTLVTRADAASILFTALKTKCLIRCRLSPRSFAHVAPVFPLRIPPPSTNPPPSKPAPPPAGSSISVNCAPPTAPSWPAGSPVRVSGAISPAVANAPVTLLYTPPSGSTTTHTTQTDSSGGYQDSITPLVGQAGQTGNWTVKASWPGNSSYTGASNSCTFSVH